MHTETDSRHGGFIHECIECLALISVIMVTLWLVTLLVFSVTCALTVLLAIYCRVIMLIQQIAEQIE